MNRTQVLTLALVLLSALPPLRLLRPGARPHPRHPLRRDARPAQCDHRLAGVEVGHATIIRGDGRLVVGQGPVRTGVTAVLPRGKHSA